jgi:hypothetical protein
MAKHYHPKRLLVEGQDDLRVIPELIEKNGIHWGSKKEEAIISIQECSVQHIALQKNIIWNQYLKTFLITNCSQNILMT